MTLTHITPTFGLLLGNKAPSSCIIAWYLGGVETYFETKHQLTAKQLCEMYNFKYKRVSNENDLKTALVSFYNESSQPKLLEINTADHLNDEILLEYFNYIK